MRRYGTLYSHFSGSLNIHEQHSFLVRGEGLVLFSGELHPFRLLVPGIWLDVFEKLKAAGFNAAL